MKRIFLPGLVAGLVMAVIGMALNSLWQVIFPGLKTEYETSLFRPWSDPLMSLIFVAPILSGFVTALIWKRANGGFHLFHIHSESTLHKRVVSFSMTFILMSTIGILITYSCFPISFLMMLTWIVSTAIQYYAGTWVLAKMMKV